MADRGSFRPAHQPFRGAIKAVPDLPKAEKKRPTEIGGPVTPKVECPVCHAQVGTRHKPGEWDPNGPRYITRHRPGGGIVLVRRGDVACQGEGEIAS